MAMTKLQYHQSIGYPVKVFCPVCEWSSGNQISEARFCPYGHGELSAICGQLPDLAPELPYMGVKHIGHGALTYVSSPSNEGAKTQVNKIEEIPQKVNTGCPGPKSQNIEVDTTSIFPSYEPFINPYGTLARQRCMGCDYEATVKYPADCPTCRNPWPVRMALAEPWHVLLKRAKGEPQEVVSQLSLLGGIA